MDRHKDQQPAVSRRRTASKNTPVSDTKNTPQQVGITQSAEDKQNTTSNPAFLTTQELRAHEQEEEIARTAVLLFEHVEGQISRADTKAQLILAADALLAGTIALLDKGAASGLLSNTSPVLDRLADLFAILMFLALACSFYWAFRVISPHLQGAKHLTLLYFGQIARMDEDAFIDTFLNRSSRELKTAMLAEVHIKARIARFKFTRARWSINFLLVSLACWAIIQLLLAFS